MKYCTTIEQSKKLVDLGIDVDTADMYHSIIPESITNENGYAVYDINILKSAISFSDIKKTLENIYSGYKGPVPIQFIPCWSTEALLDILDDIIVFGTEEDCHEYTLHFGKDGTSYYMYYEDTEFVANNIVDELDFSCSTLLNCAFEMIVKLKELKLI